MSRGAPRRTMKPARQTTSALLSHPNRVLNGARFLLPATLTLDVNDDSLVLAPAPLAARARRKAFAILLSNGWQTISVRATPDTICGFSYDRMFLVDDAVFTERSSVDARCAQGLLL